MILKLLSVLLVVFLSGCAGHDTKQLKDVTEVTHKDGFMVTVVHSGSSPVAIIDNCGKYTTQYPLVRGKLQRIGGCATRVTYVGQTCYVYAPMFDKRIWEHELEHCRGYTHKEMIERGTM